MDDFLLVLKYTFLVLVALFCIRCFGKWIFANKGEESDDLY